MQYTFNGAAWIWPVANGIKVIWICRKDDMTDNSDDCMNVVERTKLRVAHARMNFTWVQTNVRSKAGRSQKAVGIFLSYRCLVWSAAEPPLALCQPTLRGGCRRRAPLVRTQVGHTRAAPPRTGSAFQCLWCLLVARSSSGRLYTVRKNK